MAGTTKLMVLAAEGNAMPRVVLITYGDRAEFIAGERVGKSEPVAPDAFEEARYRRSKWEVSLPEKLVPVSHDLEAWVYDPARNAFVRLGEQD